MEPGSLVVSNWAFLTVFVGVMYKLSCQAANKVCLGLAACLLLASGRAQRGILYLKLALSVCEHT
jgi:hypothetical protein